MEIFDFGLRLKQLRESHGFTQEYVAKKIGIARNTVSAYETNIKSPRVEVLVDMAILYHSSLDYIVGLSHRKNITLDAFNEEQQEVIANFISCLEEKFVD